MPDAGGPCSAANQAGWPFGSLLTMKLMSPCRYSATFLERCVATLLKPSFSKVGSRTSGAGEANSTHSNPMSPIGLSKRSAMARLHRLLDQRCPGTVHRVEDLAQQDRQARDERHHGEDKEDRDQLVEIQLDERIDEGERDERCHQQRCKDRRRDREVNELDAPHFVFELLL